MFRAQLKDTVPVSAEQKDEQTGKPLHDNFIAALYSAQWTWIVANGGNQAAQFPPPTAHPDVRQQKEAVPRRTWPCLCEGLCPLQLMAACIWTVSWGVFPNDQDCKKEISS